MSPRPFRPPSRPNFHPIQCLLLSMLLSSSAILLANCQYDTPLYNGNGHGIGAGGSNFPLPPSPYQMSPAYGGPSPYQPTPMAPFPPSPQIPQPLFGTGYPMFSPANSYVCIPYCPPNKYGNGFGGNPANFSPYGYGPFGSAGFGQPPFGGIGGPMSGGGPIGGIGNGGGGGGFQYGGKGFFGQLPGGGIDSGVGAAGGPLPNSGAYIQTEQLGMNGAGLAGGPVGGGPMGNAGLFGANGGIFGGHRRSAKNVLNMAGPLGKVEDLNSQQQKKTEKN